MAKNWTIKEAYEAIKAEDKSAILDFGKRFPLATMAVARMQQADLLVSGLPEHVTMRKVDSFLKDGVEPYEEEGVEKKPAPKVPNHNPSGKRGRPAKVKEVEEEEAPEGNPYEGMSAVELFKECKKRGLTVQPKQKSKVYIDLLLEEDKKVKSADEDETDDWDDGEEDEEEEKASKKSAKTPTKASKATPVKKSKAKKEEPEEDESEPDEDDEDSWDI